MSVHYLLFAAAAVDPYTLTTGRLVGTVAAFVALAGVVTGGLALARSAGRIGRWGAVAALVTGPAGMVVGGLVLAAARGGPGAGYGVVGGYAALVIGLIATVLGLLALVRARRVTAGVERLGARKP